MVVARDMLQKDCGGTGMSLGVMQAIPRNTHRSAFRGPGFLLHGHPSALVEHLRHSMRKSSGWELLEKVPAFLIPVLPAVLPSCLATGP